MTLASDPQQHAAGQRWPENRVYTGEPSQALDDNWEDLIGDRYFSISEDEAVEAWGEHRFAYVDEERGGYTAGLDVFHTLHCLVCVFFFAGLKKLLLFVKKWTKRGS